VADSVAESRMAAIKTINLTRKFDALLAVDNLNLEVNSGEIFGLVGPDGAGKTTTMRLLTGILEPTSGDAWVDDRHIVKEAELLKETIGYMSQRFGLYEDLTVIENISFYADVYCVPRNQTAKKIDELLGFSGLLPFKSRLAGNLSGGMKQKLGLACALIHTPKVLFLDEPTNGVDPVSRRDFWQILYNLQKQNVTIFISTAYLDEADRCSRVGLLHKGRLLRCDAPDAIKNQIGADSMEQAFISIIKEYEKSGS
jgi:ABC-2 type transport system ATP-binding protein